MMLTKLGIGILLILVNSNSSRADPGIITTVTKLLIDTDAGGDDSVALLMALEAERLDDGPKVIAITCVNGNTDVDQVALNVLKVLKVADRLDIPVYKGASHPLVLPNRKDNYFGEDGFGDFEFPDPPSADLIPSKHAVNAMIDVVKAHPGEVALLGLGPLTNVALAIRMYPQFLDELQQLVIMGGSTGSQGNARPGIEFNFYADPIANFIVFKAATSLVLTLLPFETAEDTYMTMDLRKSFSEFNNTKTWLIDHTDPWTPEEDLWSSADAVAATIALTSGSIVTKSEIYYTEAIYDEPQTSGMIIVDYTNITGNPGNTNLIESVNSKVWEQLLLKYISN